MCGKSRLGIGARCAESRRGDGDRASFGEGCADGVGDFCDGETFFNAGEDGGVGGRSAVVIAEECVERIGSGADYSDGFDFGVEGKSEFTGFAARLGRIFEKDDGLASGFESEFAIGWGIDIGESEFGPWNAGGRIEHAEAEPGFEETADGAVDVLWRDETILESVVEGFVLRAASEIRAGSEREGGSLGERHDEAVALVKIVDGPAVGDNVAAKAPLIAEKTEKELIGAGGFTADGIVGAHDGVGVAINDGGAEGGRVGVVKIVKRNRNIEAVTDGFGAAVNGVMLGSRNGFEKVRIVALKACDEGYAETAGEKGIFAVSFLTATPAGITEDIDVGRPESETVVTARVVVGDGVIVFAAGFGGDDVGDGVDQFGVPGGGEADGLGKDGGGTGARDTVKAFIPPVVGGDLEARDGGSNVLHLGDFFVEGEARDEVVDAGVERERGVEVGRSGGGRLCLSEREGWEKEKRDEKNS